MGSNFRQDKIGALSEAGGTISLQPSILTIGGRQFETTSILNVALPVMTANTRYQIFAIQSAGVVSLVISTNENSVGPVGSVSWKLVGCFYANGLSSVGFGSFVTISGLPQTLNAVQSDIQMFRRGDGLGWTSTPRAAWQRIGNAMSMSWGASGDGSAAGAGNYSVLMPSGFSVDQSSLVEPNGGDGGSHSFSNLTLAASQWTKNPIFFATDTEMNVLPPNSTGTLQKSQVQTNSVCIGNFRNVVINEWSSTPIEDL